MHPQGGSSSYDLTFHVCGVESTKGKSSWAEERINNKLPGCEPRSHWNIGVREIFCQGGAVNHLPKKTRQVAQILTKESKRNEGHIATT